MITEVCAEIRNYFVLSNDVLTGDYTISEGSIVPSVLLQDGQYYRIVGSTLNDGVHKYGDESDILIDEPQFHGAVWKMRVPQSFINLVNDIQAWQEKNGGADSANLSPFSSESFGGYSYTKGARTSNTGASTGVMGWKDAFAARLNVYRKIRAI